MKKSLQIALLAAGLLVSFSTTGLAQDTYRSQQNNNPSYVTEGKVLVLSGCLGRGAGADEYSLHLVGTATSWELKSDSVNLGGHMDQMVVVTAVKIDDRLPLKVIGLTMDSTSCNSW